MPSERSVRIVIMCVSPPALQEQYAGMRDIFKKTLYLLKLLARENEAVQHHIFERLDILLEVRVVESDLAIALTEVRSC